MVAMCPTTVHVGNSTIVYLTRNQTVLIVVAEWMLEKINRSGSKFREGTSACQVFGPSLPTKTHVKEINQCEGTLSSIWKKHDKRT